MDIKYKIEEFTIKFFIGNIILSTSLDIIIDPFLDIRFTKDEISYFSKYKDDVVKYKDDVSFKYTKDFSCRSDYYCNIFWSRLVTRIYYDILEYENPNTSFKNKLLYFMMNKDGLIKIGISNDPEYRRKTLEYQLSDKITILKTLPYAEFERLLHKKYNLYNANYKGCVEWFTPYPDLLEFIDKIDEKNFIKEFNKIKLKNGTEG